MRLIKRVESGHRLPRWAGVVLMDHARQEVICCPLGVNLVVRAVLAFALWLRRYRLA